jgi:hypothetical protein
MPGAHHHQTSAVLSLTFVVEERLDAYVIQILALVQVLRRSMDEGAEPGPSRQLLQE